MPINLGALIIKGTAWLAVFLFLAALLFKPALGVQHPRERRARRLWTAGCAVYLIHFLLGFQGYYDFSHEAAEVVMAQTTYDIANVRWGGAIYANYLFTALWLADVLWWQIKPAAYAARPAWLNRAILVFLCLPTLCGAVLFTPNPLRWLALAAFLLVAAQAAKGLSKPQAITSP